MEDLGFVAFSAFRADAGFYNASEIWAELPDEIRAQWVAAAVAVREHLMAYIPHPDDYPPVT